MSGRDQTFDALARSALLRGASGALRAALGRSARSVALAPGEYLFRQGDPGDALFEIQAGRVEASVLSVNGRKLTLNTMGPGEVFGEIALLDQGPRTAAVMALEPSDLTRFARADVMAEVRADPELGIEIMALAGARLRWISDRLTEREFEPLNVRLARRLLHLAQSSGSGAVRISQDELAAHVGVTRVAVANILGKWRRAGLVRPGRGVITVTDAPQLSRIATGTEIPDSV